MSRKVRMGSSRRRLNKTAILAPDETSKSQTDSDMTTEHTDSELGNQLGSKRRNKQHDFKEPVSETLHETSGDVANKSETFRSSLIHPPSTVENQSHSVSQKPSEPQKEDMHGNRTENLGAIASIVFTGEQCRELRENRAATQMGMLRDESCQEIKLQMSKPTNDDRTQVSQGSGDDFHPTLNSSLYSHLPDQPFANDMSNCPKPFLDSIIHKEHGSDIRKENTNHLAVSISPGTITDYCQDYIFQSKGVCDDVQSSIEKEHEVKDNVNPLLTQSETPIQSIVGPLLIKVHNQEESQQEAEQEPNTPYTPELHDTIGKSGIFVEGQPLLIIQDTFNPGKNQETTVQDHLEIMKLDHMFDLSEPEHNITENTCSQVCESEGQASNDPWELIEDPAQQEGEVPPLNIGALQSEHSSASADEENDHTLLTGRSENISLNDGTFGNLIKQPIKDEELMEPDCEDVCREKTSNLDSTIEFKDGCNNDSNITASTEFNPQSEEATPTFNFTLNESDSIDRLLVESCLSTNMTDLNPSAAVSQHCLLSGEDQCKSKEINVPTLWGQLQDDIAHVGVQTSTGLTQTEGIKTMGLNEIYLENENKNTVEMQEEETDFQQNSDCTAADPSHFEKDVYFKLTEVASSISNINQEHDGDLDKRKKRKIGSTRRTYNRGGKGDHTGEIVESDLSTDLNMTNKSFEAELKVEMKCNSELLEGGKLATFTDKGADCLFLIPPQSVEIKERDSEDITDKEAKEINTGENIIHTPPESSLGDKDDRKEEESEEKSDIVEKMEVIKIPALKTLPERNYQEISEEMSRQYHEEDLCKAATDPQEKDYSRPPGADVPMLVQRSFTKEITPHSEDINSSILLVSGIVVPISDIKDNDDNMDTAGQHPPADLSNLDQISTPENQWPLPNIKDDDKHIVGRRKMGSSRRTTASGSKKGSKESNATQDQEMEKHAVKSEKISEEDPKEQNSKDDEEGAEMVVTDDNEPSQIGGDAHQSMSENISATQDIERRQLDSTHMTFRMTQIQENIQEKEVANEVSEDVEIKERDSEDITDKEAKERNTGENIIHTPPESSLGDKDDRKEEESEEKSEIVEKMEVITIPVLKTLPEKNDQEISEEMSRQYHEEDLCKAATDPQEKDYSRPPGADVPMLVQKSFTKEITPHSEDINSSIHLVSDIVFPISDIKDNDDNMDTAGQHPPADSSNLDQISTPENQWPLPNIKDDDKHIVRRRKMGSSRRTTASGSKKGSKESNATQDQEMEKHAVKSEKISEEDPKEQNSKDDEEGAEMVVTDDNEPSQIGGDAHQSMSENISATQDIERRQLGSTHMTFRMAQIQENIQEKEVDNEVSEDVDIKERDSEDITDKEAKERNTGENIIHTPPESSLGDKDDRKEEESEEKSEIVEKMEVIKIPVLKTLPERNDQEISEEMSRQYHEEDLCKAATDPQEKDYSRPPGADVPMLFQKSFTKEITPHSEDINSSILLVSGIVVPISDIKDNDDNMDTAGQHPPADLSNLDQISTPENQWPLPNIKDDDKHIVRRRKMGSSRRTIASGSKKGSKEANATQDQEMEKHAVKSEKISEEDPKEQNSKDDEEGAKMVVTDDNEPSQIGGDAHQSMSENISATQDIERRQLDSTHMTFRMTQIQENIQEKEVANEVSEDVEIKERGSEDITDKEAKERNTGENIIHTPPESSLGDKDDRKEEESEEKSEIVEKMEVITIPVLKTLPERNDQEISEEMSRQYHEEDLCKAATDPQEKDYSRPPGADVPMLVQKSFTKEITPHSEDINSSIHLVSGIVFPISDIKDNDDNMDTAGQHPPADSSNLDQISTPENQWPLPNIKDDDKHIVGRRKMGSSRRTTASGSKKGSKESNATQDQEMEKHAVKSEKISEEDPKEQNSKDDEEGAEMVVTDDNKPSQIGGDAHQSMSENISATQDIERRQLSSTHMTFRMAQIQENIQEKEVDNEVSEDVDIKERDSEDITDKEAKERNTGENIIHTPPESSLGDKDDRKEEESEEKSEIVEKMEVIKIPVLKTLPERNDQEISEEMSRQYHEEDLCKAATDPQEKDYSRPPGADVPMLFQKSFTKEITPHSEDINSSILLVSGIVVPISDIKDNDDNMDTAGQHPPADLSNLDQISTPENQWPLPNIKDDDKHIVRRRKMGSSRRTIASGSKKGSKEANATQDQEMEKHAVKSEKISEEDPKEQNSKDDEEGAKMVVTDDNEPSQIGGDAHQSMSENISATQDIERRQLGSTHMTFRMAQIQENIQEKEVDNEVSEDVDIKERDSEDITDKEAKERNTGENIIHTPPESSLGDKDDRKEEESEEKSEIVEKMEVIKIPVLKTLPERNDQEISEGMSRQYHEEDLCKAATDPQEKDYSRPPGADVPMLVQKSFTKEITPHSEDINSSILLVSGIVVPISDIKDNDDNMDTAGQHPPADSSNLDQISTPENQWSLPNIKDNDKHIVKRRKMGSSRRTTASGSKKGSKESNAAQDQEMEKHAVKSEKISEEDPKEQNSKDDEEGAKMVVTDDNEPSQIGGDAHQSMSENISATPDIERRQLGSTHMTFRMTQIQENIQEKDVDNEVSEDGNIFKDGLKIKKKDNDDNMDTAGQHPPADFSNLDQISAPENQWSLPNIKDDDKHVVRRRKMGSSRWTNASGSKKGSKESNATQDQEIEKHAVKSEKISEEDPKEQNSKDDEEGAEMVVTDDNEPSQIGGDAHQSMSENISATPDIERRKLGSTHMTFGMTQIQENIQEKEVDNEVSEDGNIFKDGLKKKKKDNDDNMDTAGQHPPADLSNLDQISAPENQWSLPNIKDDDKHVVRRRKMGSSRWANASGSKKGSKESNATQDQEMEKHAVKSEKISEEDPKEQNSKDDEEEVDNEVSEDDKIRNSESEENQVTGGKRVDLPISGRRRKMGSHRKVTTHFPSHEDPPESKDHRDQPTPTESLSRQITGNATLTFDTSNKCDLRANCFNVVMVGSSNVGKTSFMKRVQSGSFSSDFSASIGIDMCIHVVPVDGREVVLQLWDTAGQERFHSMSKQIFHKGQAFLLMYDITSFKSFSDVRYWISCIQESAGEDVIMLLLGNKSDCAARQVNPSEGQLLAKEYNIDFNECSAATGEHIVSSVESLARMLTERYHKIEEGVVVQKEQKKSTSCC